MSANRVTAGILALILSAGAALSPLPCIDRTLPAAAAIEVYTTGTYEGMTYKKYSNRVEITNYDDSAAVLQIPAEIAGLPVTAIGANAFQNSTSLKNVTIPDTVTSIGKSAFMECEYLEIVYFSEGLFTIGERAFEHCSFLTSVTLPDSVTEIGLRAFAHCAALSSVHVGAHTEKIGASAFTGCRKLRHASLGTDLRILSGDAFSDCVNLEQIRIPDGVAKIETSTFSGCTYLKYVTLPDSLTFIGSDAFSDCKFLEDLVLPPTVSMVDGRAFYGADKLHLVVKNPDCSLFSDENTLDRAAVISGFPDSTAKAYADTFGNSFIPLETLPGSVDLDETLTVTDAVFLQQYLLSQRSLIPKQYETADMTQDGIVDAFDLALLKKTLIGRSTT